MEISEMIMKGIFIFTVLIARYTCLPGSPRIYNVLINSKKNLVPSQAVSIYEPVLRTTSVGIALPAISYTPNILEPVYTQYGQLHNYVGPQANIIPQDYSAMYPAYLINDAQLFVQPETEPKNNTDKVKES